MVYPFIVVVGYEELQGRLALWITNVGLSQYQGVRKDLRDCSFVYVCTGI